MVWEKGALYSYDHIPHAITPKKLYEHVFVKRPLCNNIPETIEHAFLECQKIHTLWRQVEVWLGMVLRDNIKIADSEKIFGTACKNSIIDTVILLTKRKIYKNR